MLKRLAAPGDGTFVPPTVLRVAGIEALEEEIFGPVLHVASFGADEIDAVVDAVNRAGYGLTFGLHTRIDDRVQHIVDRVGAGNIYVNRNQIGAVVGSQPFGGEGLSGTGPKAGGPHYVSRLTAGDAPAGGRPSGAVVNEALLAAAIADAERALATRTHRGDGGRFAPLDLPGPTGESNRLSFAPRGVVLCLGPSADAVRAQVAAAREAGNAVVAVADGASAALTSHATDPLVVVLDGQVAPDALTTPTRHRRRRLRRGSRRTHGDAGRARPARGPDPAADSGARHARALCAGAPPLRRYHGGGRKCLPASPGRELDGVIWIAAIHGA